jgi:hypothetical protein
LTRSSWSNSRADRTARERATWFLATLGVVIGGAWLIVAAVKAATTPHYVFNDAIGFDYWTYTRAASDWLAGRGFYESYQLAGPYVVNAREIMYPPVILPLLVPFTVLPAVLWWALPTAATVAMIAWHRPSRLAVAAILLLLCWPDSLIAWFTGNPVIWVMAIAALGTRWPAAAPWVLLKPVFAPFALVGVRTRTWWFGLAAFAAVSALFLPMWPDYVAVIRNAAWPGGNPAYALVQSPLLAIPLIAWAGRRTAHTA